MATAKFFMYDYDFDGMHIVRGGGGGEGGELPFTINFFFFFLQNFPVMADIFYFFFMFIMVRGQPKGARARAVAKSMMRSPLPSSGQPDALAIPGHLLRHLHGGAQCAGLSL